MRVQPIGDIVRDRCGSRCIGHGLQSVVSIERVVCHGTVGKNLLHDLASGVIGCTVAPPRRLVIASRFPSRSYCICSTLPSGYRVERRFPAAS